MVKNGFGCSASWWWLRSPGNNTNNACNVNNDGNINLNGNNVNNTSGGVRPALSHPHLPETLGLSRQVCAYEAKEPKTFLLETSGK